MSEKVICLSDSEDSVHSATNDEPDDCHGYEEEGFDFPAVGFAYHAKESVNISDRKKHDASPRRKIGRNDEFVETEHSDSGSADRFGVTMENTRVTQKMPQESYAPKQTRRKAKEKTSTEATRETRAEQIAREKALKALERKRQKEMQPGECLKFMQVCLDRSLENFGFYLGIVDALVNVDVSWELKTLPVTNSIVWIRKTEEFCVSRTNKVCSETNGETENQIIIIWSSEEAIRRVKEDSFVSGVRESLKTATSMRPTLILYGMENYFRDKRKGKQNGAKISRQELENCLAEIQLTVDCNSQLIDTPEDLGSLVYRYTKSIAEIPYKMEKRLKYAEKLDWYAAGNNRDTVKVDSSGNGLKRLWQQQLCQLNLASLETANAVSSVYPSPFQLMQAYRNCTRSEGEKLLKDITIRRAAGPLSTARKIGPELSKKIFIMFTSKDGEATLSNEKEQKRS